MQFTLEDGAKIATIIGVVVALIVYISNSRATRRQRVIENLERYLGAHNRTFSEGSYPMLNVQAMENGTFKRDTSDATMELKFNRFLSGIEQIAMLHNAGAVPKGINAYMLGWFAKHLYPVLTDREKAEPYWVVSVEFLKRTKQEAEALDKMSAEDRLKFVKKQHI